MLLLGQLALKQAGRANAPLRAWLDRWIEAVREADWNSLQDVREAYPSADAVKLNSGLVVTIFNVKGNAYRLLADIHYDVQTVEVLEVLTHAEYDKERWKTRY